MVTNPDPGTPAVIKQANVGIGVVTPGQPIRVSFAAKGSGEIGGVGFAEFFSELEFGGVSAAEILGGGPLPLTDEYQTFTFDVTTGPDVSGGITLQFAAVTDGQVSFGDFLFALTVLGPCPGGTPGCDFDIADDFGFAGADGQVSFGDFLFALTILGPCP